MWAGDDDDDDGDNDNDDDDDNDHVQLWPGEAAEPGRAGQAGLHQRGGGGGAAHLDWSSVLQYDDLCK